MTTRSLLLYFPLRKSDAMFSGSKVPLLRLCLLSALRANTELWICHPFLQKGVRSAVDNSPLLQIRWDLTLMRGLSCDPRSVHSKDFSRMIVGEPCSGFGQYQRSRSACTTSA